MIAAGVDDVLGHRQAASVVVGIDDLVELLEPGVIEALEDFVLVVVADRFSPKPINLCVVLKRGLRVGHVDYDRHDGFDAVVSSSGHPSCPASLGATSDDELIDLAFAAGLARRKFGDAVHGSHNAFDHWQAG